MPANSPALPFNASDISGSTNSPATIPMLQKSRWVRWWAEKLADDGNITICYPFDTVFPVQNCGVKNYLQCLGVPQNSCVRKKFRASCIDVPRSAEGMPERINTNKDRGH